jgi:hypothetical protein
MLLFCFFIKAKSEIMKKFLLIVALVLLISIEVNAQTEFKLVTTIESIVPMGIGRSRIIINGSEIDYNQYTTIRTDGKKSDQKNIKRGNIKVDEFSETKMLNFYSAVGINFQNIASNDALITSVLNSVSAEGWELFQIVSGVESDAGKGDGNGLFITRYIFKKEK